MDEIVNADLKRRLDRQSMLKKLNQKYQDMMRERRETARKLSESAASGDQFAGPDQKSLSRRYDGLMDRRLTLRLDRAQTETLLGRKSKGAGSQTEEVRKEIALLEEHLAVLTAQETVLHEELDHLTRESRNAANGRLDLAETMTDLAAMEDTYRKVRAEVEALTVELEGPRRIRVLEGAVAQPGNK
jgi:chromosome segregation ATPase